MPTTNPLPDGFRVEREPDRNGESVSFVVYREGYVWKNGDPRSLLTVTLHVPSEMGLAHDGVPKITYPSTGNDPSLEVALAMHAALAMAINEAQHGPDERVAQ